MDLATAKERIVAEVERRADLLIDASHQLHAHPELAFEEHFAHDLLTGIISEFEKHAWFLRASLEG